MSGTYRDLKVWQSAMELTTAIYRVTQKFPRHEIYGLASQLQRASVSVASNIAEGKGRGSDKELVQFLNRARGSLFEVETQVEIAQSLTYITGAELKALSLQTQLVGKMLNGMIAKIRQTIESAAA